MYEVKDFSRLLGMEGMSDALLNNHFTLYQGYVKQTNALFEKFNTTEAGSPEFAELHRRFGWEWNGMRLHELYFDNLTKGGANLNEGTLKRKIDAAWGSVENWQKDFVGIGTMRGIGWAMLAYDENNDKLINIWINEHDTGHLAGVMPLLVMDVFEHAFMLDYGVKRADYINAFMASVDWHTVEERL